MIIQKSRLLLDEEEARIAATVLSETGGFAPFDLVIGVPRAYVGWLDRTANPFVPTLFLLAGVLGERLRLEGTVSAQLLSKMRKVSELLQSWWGIRAVRVEAETAHSSPHPREGNALFFTRGVDSWHSALRDRSDELHGPLTHLLYCRDLDRQYSPGTRRRAVQLTREAADCLGLPLLIVSHNGRELLDHFVNWERSHGGVLAGIGLALGGYFANVHLASTHDSGHLIPWGSHPALDPLWSTAETTLHLDGAQTTRTDKVKAIATADFALSRLKVCWREDIDTNCGRCEKCVRTQCALAIAGALERAQPAFQTSLSVEVIAELPALGAWSSTESAPEPFWVELCESFTDEPRLAQLRIAACNRLPRWHPLSTARNERDARSITIEAPRGAALSLLPPSAGDVLPAPITQREAPAGTDSTTCHLEITWTTPSPGRVALPLRPPSSMATEILEACQVSNVRPIPWCLIAFAEQETAQLMARLTSSWGQGIACLTRRGQGEDDHGIPFNEAGLIQRSSETRVWWGKASYLDPFLVLESLRHGCLPLQCVPQSSYDALAESLPPGLVQFTLPIPDLGPIPAISEAERTARIESGLSIVLAGNLERDLAQVIPLLN
jgi:hypothetical protein